MLAHDKIGTGIPLVFIHAFPLSRKMWKPNISALSRNFQFIALDMPGFGESPLGGEVSSMEYMADEVAATLESMGITQKIIIAGVSMGGYVCLPFFKKYAERVRGLVLISTRATGDSEITRAKRMENILVVQKQGIGPLIETMMNGVFGETSKRTRPLTISEVRKWMEECTQAGVIAALKGMAARPDSTPVLSSIGIPTLVLTGEEDKLSPPTEVEGMARMIKTVEYQILLKAGHLLTLEKPDEFNELFLKFLKRRIL